MHLVFNQLINVRTIQTQTEFRWVGQGATGFDYTSTPPSGGGGGYCGGYDSLSDDEVWLPNTDSGSSYAKECINNDYDEELCFFNVEMFSCVKEGDGSLIITKIWECEDDNCLYCKSAANQCQTCKQGFLRHNGICVTSCPESYQNGIDCIDCNPECKTCQKSKDECTSCIDSYYLHYNGCYSNCSWLNDEMINSFFGKDLIENKCINCIDINSINCDE